MKLTIAIPTFNRNKILQYTLNAIMPQLCHNVELVVVDNASTEPVEKMVMDMAKMHNQLDRVRCITNACNIGANANIMRCFEVANGDWIWVLGDDDIPCQDAINKTLSSLCDELLVVICYAANSRSTAARGVGIEYIKNVDFGDALFISGNIVNRKLTSKHMGAGHEGVYSCAPHLCMIYAALASGAHYLILRDSIVNHGDPGPAGRWNPVKVGARLLALLELPYLKDESRRHLATRIDEHYGPEIKKWLLWFTQLTIHSEGQRSWFYAHHLLQSWSSIRPSYLKRCMLLLCLPFFENKLSAPVLAYAVRCMARNRVEYFGKVDAAL